MRNINIIANELSGDTSEDEISPSN